VHAYNPSTQEAEAGGSLSSRPIWSIKWAPHEATQRNSVWKKRSSSSSSQWSILGWELNTELRLLEKKTHRPWLGGWSGSFSERLPTATAWITETEQALSLGLHLAVHRSGRQHLLPAQQPESLSTTQEETRDALGRTPPSFYTGLRPRAHAPTHQQVQVLET